MKQLQLGIQQNNMSEIKVNKLSPRSGTDITLGNSGTDFIVPSGATITVNSGGQIVNNGTSEGFGIAWQAVTTAATLTTIAGKGYPINTTSNACTVTLPSSASVGDSIQIVDYAGTFATNNITLTSSLNIEGGALDKLLTTNREGVTITYVDVTQGWVASSGVNSGNQALDPVPYSVDFLVVAGGGGGGGNAFPNYASGGGGAGGYRTSTQTVNGGTEITITVGDGGAVGTAGSNSSISGSGLTTITSAGGGNGGHGGNSAGNTGANGGSGGGGGYNAASGSGNTPSTSPSQGNSGGQATTGSATAGGGGGGAGAVGSNGLGDPSATGGAGGNGTASSITGSSVTYAGGGGGGSGYTAGSGTGGTGGTGGGGAGGGTGNGTVGTANTGGGGGGARGSFTSGSGGKGVVILSMPLASFSNTVTGSPTESDDGTTKVLIFNGDGSYTA